MTIRQQQIERQYEHLLELAKQRSAKLKEACDMHRLSREAGELEQWLNIKQDLTNDVVKTHEDDPTLNKDMLDSNLDALKQELRAKEAKVAELMNIAEELKKNNKSDQAERVYNEVEKQKKNLENFKKFVEACEKKLIKANEMKKFRMDRDDTLEWINAKKQHLLDQNSQSKLLF